MRIRTLSTTAVTLVAVALLTTGCNLHGWGWNSSGQLGDATNTDSSAPIQIGASGDWLNVNAGSEHTCGVRLDRALRCWGWNGGGQLGDGTTINQSAPIQIGSDTNWGTVSGGWRHTCGVRTTGTLWCWGSNVRGQLGTSAGGIEPSQVDTLTNWKAVSAGMEHTCAIRTDGTLWCWGWNGAGQVGDGTTTNRHTPVQIGTDTNWRTISLGGEHTCGVRTDATLWCWGWNAWGQVGDASNVNRAVPTEISAGDSWTSVSAGGAHTCGIRTVSDAATVACWGQNSWGQLGDGSTTGSSEPINIEVGVSTVRSVEAGGSRTNGAHTCATTVGGSMYCWGNNDVGQLGDGTTTERHEPTTLAVPVPPPWKSVTLGDFHTLGIRS